MALQDILDAISAEADQKIATARSDQQKRIHDLRDESDKRIADRQQDIAAQRDQKQAAMLAKAQSHAQMMVRNAELKQKQSLLNQLYSDVAASLAKLPKDKLEAYFKHCLSQLPEKGIIRPTKAHAELLKPMLKGELTLGDPIDGSGGFVFESEKFERDFRFEHVVQSTLRPKTEVETAHSLFA